jgi:LuxR family maltose regulon positive regulatory protein
MGAVLRERGRQGALLRLRILETLHLYDTDQGERAYALLDAVLPRMAGRKEIRPVLNYGEPFRTLLNAYLSEHEVSSDIRSVVRILIQELEATRGIRLIPGFEQSLVDPLTEREQEVLGYLARGYTNREIANRLYVSVNTVKTHLKNLYGKLGVSSREEAVEWGEGGP